MRVLIYYKKTDLKPIGGPSGYLNNLLDGWKDLNSVIQLELLAGNETVDHLKTFYKSSNSAVVKYLLKKYRRLKFIKNVVSVVGRQQKACVDLNRYDIVHFHSTQQMYLLRDELEAFKGKVLLTSHSPQPLFAEYREAATKKEKYLFKRAFDRLENMDQYAFERADYVVFPTEYSDEPYLKYWDNYKKIKKEKADKYKYFLTGTVKAEAKIERNVIRKQYGIPENAFVITYVGRHNKIKGYDRFIEICLRYMQQRDDVYILVAGAQGKVDSPCVNKWIEIGWTNDPHSIINAGDVFVLPNRETYFDLVMLEVLSLGKIILASETGGNKYFKNCDGVILYSNEEECVEKLKKLSQLNPAQIEKLEMSNEKLYKEKFTPEMFARGYEKMLQNIV